MSSRGRGRGRGGFIDRGGHDRGMPSFRPRVDQGYRGDEHHAYRGGHGRGEHYPQGRSSGGEYGRPRKEMGHGVRGMPPHARDRSRSDDRYHERRPPPDERGGFEGREHRVRRTPPPHHRRPSPPPRRPEHLLDKLDSDEKAILSVMVNKILGDREGGGHGYRDERGRDDREYREDYRRPQSYGAPPSRYSRGGRDGFREESRGRPSYRGRGSSRGGRFESGMQHRLGLPHRGDSESRYKRKYSELSEQPYKRPRMENEANRVKSGSRASREEAETEEEAPRAEGEKGQEKIKKSVIKEDEDADTDEEVATAEEEEEEGDRKKKNEKFERAEGEREAARSAHRRNDDSCDYVFMELQCPHCPAHCFISLKEYRYHLSSVQHQSNMKRLSLKHSEILLRIRKLQRQRQKMLEDEYLDKHPDQAEISVSRFCWTCKLNFRCLGGDIQEGLMAHNKSRLHKLQEKYLHPTCAVCKAPGEPPVKFKSRVVFDHHIASVAHMQNKLEKMELIPDDLADDTGDLEGFMTLEAVGEDDEGDFNKKEGEASKDREDGSKEEEVPDGMLEPLGESYVTMLKIYHCRLCFLNIKENGVKRHCSTPKHRNRYMEAIAKKEKEKNTDKNYFPRSGGRDDNGRHDDDEEDELENAKKQQQHEKIAEHDDDDLGSKDDEKDYEEYNEKYEYTEDEEHHDEEDELHGEEEEEEHHHDKRDNNFESHVEDEQWDEIENDLREGPGYYSGDEAEHETERKHRSSTLRKGSDKRRTVETDEVLEELRSKSSVEQQEEQILSEEELEECQPGEDVLYNTTDSQKNVERIEEDEDMEEGELAATRDEEDSVTQESEATEETKDENTSQELCEEEEQSEPPRRRTRASRVASVDSRRPLRRSTRRHLADEDSLDAEVENDHEEAEPCTGTDDE